MSFTGFDLIYYTYILYNLTTLKYVLQWTPLIKLTLSPTQSELNLMNLIDNKKKNKHLFCFYYIKYVYTRYMLIIINYYNFYYLLKICVHSC